jgi:sugar phosphate isomerase/epimerase
MAIVGFSIHADCRVMAMHSKLHDQISLNTLCFTPAPLDSHIEAVSRLGARAISPGIHDVGEIGVAKTARFIRDAGLEVATLTHMAFGFAMPNITAEARARLHRTIGVAAEIGAQCVIMTTGGRGTLSWADAAQAFAEAIAPCAEEARAAGILIGIEGTSHLYADVSIAHRLTDTVRLARMAGISVMIDTFACWFDSDIEEAIAEAGPLTALVQVSDYVYGDRGLPCRAVPGDGDSGLGHIIPAIAATGFSGYYDLEVIGPRLAGEGPEVGLRRAADFVSSLLEEGLTR